MIIACRKTSRRVLRPAVPRRPASLAGDRGRGRGAPRHRERWPSWSPAPHPWRGGAGPRPRNRRRFAPHCARTLGPVAL